MRAIHLIMEHDVSAHSGIFRAWVCGACLGRSGLWIACVYKRASFCGLLVAMIVLYGLISLGALIVYCVLQTMEDGNAKHV